MRWNSFTEGPEACTGWTTNVTVLATASALLALSSTSNTQLASRSSPPEKNQNKKSTKSESEKKNDGEVKGYKGGGKRAALVAAWATKTHVHLLTTASDAAARLASAAGLGVGLGGPNVAVHCAAENLGNHAIVHFLGLVVAVTAVPGSCGGVRPVLWMYQGPPGNCVEATLPPVTPPVNPSAAERPSDVDDAAAAKEATIRLNTHTHITSTAKQTCEDGGASNAAAAATAVDATAEAWRQKLEGKVVELSDARVRYRGGSDRYCLVAAPESSRWRVLDEDDPRSVDVTARCKIARVLATTSSLAEMRRTGPPVGPGPYTHSHAFILFYCMLDLILRTERMH